MGGKVVFKEYDPDQLMFLPYKLEELVPQGHPVRIVSKVVDQVDVKPINKEYKGGGASSFHPRLMLKLLVYGYLTNPSINAPMSTLNLFIPFLTCI